MPRVIDAQIYSVNTLFMINIEIPSADPDTTELHIMDMHSKDAGPTRGLIVPMYPLGIIALNPTRTSRIWNGCKGVSVGAYRV